MRSSEVVFSSIHLMVVLLILAVGFGLILESYVPSFRYGITLFLTESTKGPFIVGIVLWIMGILMLLGFYNMYRRKYYKLRLSCSKVLIEESIIEEYVKNYWQTIFPEKANELKVTIGPKQHIEIIAKLPEKEDLESLLERIKNELGILLARKLGYEKEFTLTVII